MSRLARLLIPFAFASLVGCSDDPDPVAARPPDAGADAPTDTPATDPAPKTNEEFLSAAAAPICERTYNCCTTESERKSVLFFFGMSEVPADVNACKTSITKPLADFASLASDSFRHGRMRFVPEEAAACLAKLESATASCDHVADDGVVDWLSCPKAYVPLVPLGGECWMTTECIDSVCRPDDAAGTSAHCQALGKEGDACLGAETCEAGLSCSQDHGGGCTTEIAQTCIAKRPKGAFCCSTDDCVAGTECVANGDGDPQCSEPSPSSPTGPICDGK